MANCIFFPEDPGCQADVEEDPIADGGSDGGSGSGGNGSATGSAALFGASEDWTEGTSPGQG